MNIIQAQALKVGDRVKYPADRGEKAGEGVVTHVGESVYESHQDKEFIWVTVSAVGKKSTWPSNRLG